VLQKENFDSKRKEKVLGFIAKIQEKKVQNKNKRQQQTHNKAI
jgi:hypothetical protein